MKVYVVFAQSYEEAWVPAVFSDRDKAEKYAEQATRESRKRARQVVHMEYTVEEHEVDSEEVW